jgi:hypothetical protein
MDNSKQPFVIESPTRIRLYATARRWAQAHGMTLDEMARHLLTQHSLREAGLTQQQGIN